MSDQERPEADETFDERLQRLRLRIDLLPAKQRPRLFELADVIERHHRRAQQRRGQSSHATD